MTPIPLLAQTIFTGGVILIAVVLIAVTLIIGIAVVLSRYTKVGPNEGLIVRGKKFPPFPPRDKTPARPTCTPPAPPSSPLPPARTRPALSPQQSAVRYA